MDEINDPIGPALMPKAAASFVSMAKDATGVDLDYSPASLRVVEAILQRFHEETQAREGLNGILFTCGAYVGEVIVRHHDGEWVALDEIDADTAKALEATVASLPVVLLCEDNYASPFDRAAKRVREGRESSIVDYANWLTKSDFVPAIVAKPRKGGLLGRLFG